MPDFLPSKDALLLSWSANFSTKITATPTAYGLVAAQATAYAALNTTYSTTYATAINPATRTKGTILAKNDARIPLRASARNLARIIQAFPTLTNTQRADLGITVRDVTPSPINPPTESPVMEVVSANGRALTLKLRSVDSERRGKPPGVHGASLFSYVGATPPADISAWKFEGSTTRTSFVMEFAPTVPAGSQVWLTAFWFNPRSESGPACMPISAFIAGGVVAAAA